MNPVLSIIIPAFNVEAYIGEAIQSAQFQTEENLEIVVIDDHSTDHTRDRIESFLSDPRVRLVQNRRSNSGTSGARNAGIEIASGRYIGFLDGDDIWLPGKARCHLELMQRRPDIALTFSRWRTVDERGRDTGRVSPRPAKHTFQMEDLLQENLVGGSSNVICRRAAIDQAGVFDTRLRAAVDLDLWLRIARLHDGNICFIDEVLTLYRLRDGQITKDWRRMAENWELIVARLRSELPERVARVEKDARAKHLRYRSYLAYEAEDFDAARKLLWQAFSSGSFPLLRDRRTWITAAAALGSTLPGPLHRFLALNAKKWRARLFCSAPNAPTGLHP